MSILDDLDRHIQRAIANFWLTRDAQTSKQRSSGQIDTGSRGAVTGGKQMGGFEEIAVQIAIEKGLDPRSIFYSKSLDLPGYFRPEKQWDLLIVDRGTLVAALEFKSQVGPSFGNNFNNRTEEAIGSAVDLWVAYREGAFGDRIKPWLGYLFVLEKDRRSTSLVRLRESHFRVFPEFRNTSYAKRYELLLTKLIRERHYDGGCLILSPKDQEQYEEPCQLLEAQRFFTQLAGHLETHVRTLTRSEHHEG